jgi:cytochrome c oxidase subunit IV
LVKEETMSERLLTPMAYMIVLVVLLLLTVLTVGLSFVPTSGVTRIVAGQVIAVVKASLVVLFFMHALKSAAQTRAVIAVTVFWFVVVMLALVFTDYATRGMIPNLPGH